MPRPFVCLSLLLLLTPGLSSCGLFDDPTTSSVSCAPNCGTTITEKTVTVGGKLAQNYVKGARVWADKLVNGEGDLKWQNGESLAVSSSDGGYHLTEITGDFQVVTYGGKKQDSAGNWIDAIPMVAPAPEAGQTTTNVTPLTTLVAFEPALKQKLAAYGDWNADIASPNGVSSNLLRIAKTVETLSSTISGGDSPLITDFNANLKSLGVLATQLNATGGDLASDTVLKASASNALTTIVADTTLVQNTPTAAKKSQLTNSLEQAVQGITGAISATNEVVLEDSVLLSQIEEVLDNASIDDTVSITLNMGGSNLNFGAIITEIEMQWVANTLVLIATVADDDYSSLDYNWSTTSSPLSVTNPSLPTARVSNFDGSSLRVSLTLIDIAANDFTDTRSCVWQTNPTICEF
ncbi:MAG: hypothetical protein O2885_04265 [Proteobacteria bacterium]|nr:hypothetical protein [Pseudomonadota bacterium]MDA0855140.1 hypothetical protein [Pseudomonadota bacterium]